MTEWGFDYVTGLPWVKTTPSRAELRVGIGFWFMSSSELLLVGVRGKPKRVGRPGVFGMLSGDARQFYAARRGHSEKPFGVHEFAEQWLPGPRLELFAVSARPGWTCWGLGTGFWLGPNGVDVVRPVGAKLRDRQMQLW